MAILWNVVPCTLVDIALAKAVIMVAVRYSETSGNVYQPIQSYVSERAIIIITDHEFKNDGYLSVRS